MSKLRLISKDKKNIEIFLKNEKTYLLYKSLYNNLNIPFFLRKKIYYKYIKYSKKMKINLKCLITGRSQSRYSFFGISRIKIRDLTSFSHLTGIRKASW